MADIQVTSHTTQSEVDEIREHYNNDVRAMERALLSGDLDGYAAEDIVVTIAMLTGGALPGFIAAGEIPNPDDPSVAHLFSDEMNETLNELGEMFDQQEAVNQWLENTGHEDEIPDPALPRIPDHIPGNRDIDIPNLANIFLRFLNPAVAMILIYEQLRETLDDARMELVNAQDDLTSELNDEHIPALQDLGDSEGNQGEFAALQEKINSVRNQVQLVQQTLTTIQQIDTSFLDSIATIGNIREEGFRSLNR